MGVEKSGLLTVSPAKVVARVAAAQRFFDEVYKAYSQCVSAWSYLSFGMREICRNGDYQSLKRFIEAHPDREFLKNMANRLSPSGLPPLSYLMVGERRTTVGHLACAQLLLESGADACFRRSDAIQETLLRNAIYSSTPAMAALLVQRGAKLEDECAVRGGEPMAKAKPALVAEIRRLSQAPLDFIAEVEGDEQDVDDEKSSLVKKYR